MKRVLRTILSVCVIAATAFVATGNLASADLCQPTYPPVYWDGYPCS